MNITGGNFAELYLNVLNRVYTDFENMPSPRGMEIRELTNVLITLTNPRENLFKSVEARPYPVKYLAGELYWYFSGRRDLKFIKQYSGFWSKISDDGVTNNSAYGYLLWNEFPNEWQWAYNSLMNDKDTRQAVIHFNKPHHMVIGTKDFPCTLVGVFQIRNHTLDLTIDMRSQDVVKGLTFDLPFFSLLLQQMRLHLLERYPLLRLGKLMIFVHSLHLYQSDCALVRKLLVTRDCVETKLPSLNENIVNHRGVIVWHKSNDVMKWIYDNGGMPEEAHYLFSQENLIEWM
jgi:thymidylate synthase